MAISKLTFGKELRPSVIDTMKKTNELVDGVNALDLTTVINRLDGLDTSIANLTSRLETVVNTVNAHETELQAHANDITTIKQTLYTELSETE